MGTRDRTWDLFGYPESRAGKIAVGLVAMALGVSGMLAAMLTFAGDLAGNDAFVDPGWMDIPLVALALCGLAATLAALVALIDQRERSVLVGLALLFGAVLTYSAINGL